MVYSCANQSLTIVTSRNSQNSIGLAKESEFESLAKA